MIKKDCLYYEETNDMGATVNWCKFDREIINTCSWCNEYAHKDLVPVVRCKDCVHYHGGEYCENDTYVKPDGYCHWGERREE